MKRVHSPGSRLARRPDWPVFSGVNFVRLRGFLCAPDSRPVTGGPLECYSRYVILHLRTLQAHGLYCARHKANGVFHKNYLKSHRQHEVLN